MKLLALLTQFYDNDREAMKNGVYLDIAWCKFLGKTSGKRIHSSLAGGIGYFTGCSNIWV